MNLQPASSGLVYYTERGSGPPLLLVHGLMVTGEMFEPVLEPLATRHRLIIPDLRGHGRSRGLPGPYTVAQLADDLARLLDHLGIDTCAVLGYSQGGTVAQQLVLDHPAVCERLVLACTFAFNMATPREWLEGHVTPLLVATLGPRRMAKLLVSQVTRQLGAARADWLAGLMADQGRSLMVSAWKSAMAFDSRDRLTEIACPTLIIAGSEDRGVPPHHARMLHSGIAGSSLVTVEGADHTLVWTHSDQFVRITKDFLES